MPRTDGRTIELIQGARAGSLEAKGLLLVGCRRYLLRVARQEMDTRLRPKGGPSDLVQETFLEAHRDFAAFTGESEEELLAWLRLRLRFRISKFLRMHREAAKRTVRREVPLASGDFSPARGHIPADDRPSPSECVVAEERDHLLERAIGRLPEEYRRVIDLRYGQGLPFDQIGTSLGRTENSARKLWARAVARLRQDLRMTDA